MNETWLSTMILAVIAGVAVLLSIVLSPRRVSRWSARRLIRDAQVREQNGPEIVDADPREFHWLDLVWYDCVTKDLTSLASVASAISKTLRKYVWLPICVASGARSPARMAGSQQRSS
jgi:hypothetical protein